MPCHLIRESGAETSIGRAAAGSDWLYTPGMAASDLPERHELTRLMHAWQAGDDDARSQLFALVYEYVRGIAARTIQRQGGATITPTELAHESLLRLFDAELDLADRRHFFHVVAQAARQVLVDHVRRRLAIKRGAGEESVPLADAESATGDDPDAMLLRVNEAIHALAAVEPRQAKIIEMTYFGGFNREEVAAALDLSVGTVDRDLRFARAWLKDELRD